MRVHKNVRVSVLILNFSSYEYYNYGLFQDPQGYLLNNTRTSHTRTMEWKIHMLLPESKEGRLSQGINIS